MIYRKNKIISDSSPEIKFAIIVPAHNEATCISRTLESLKGIDYPPYLYDVVVVADNCNDNTAELVREAGLQCLERHDPSKRGKGYALEYAISALINRDYAAFVIVDADSIVDANFLRSMNSRLLSGQKVIQAYDGLSNPDASALTYLFLVGNIIENKLFYEAKSRVGLSATLRGNGMCFSREIILKHPWNAYSVTEDTEYTIGLVQQGVKIYFAPEAKVLAKQPETLHQAHIQRVRWASGNIKISKGYAFKLLLIGLRRRDFAVFDMGLSLMVVSKPLLFFVSLFLIGLSLIYFSVDSGGGRFYITWAAMLFNAQIIYVATGVLMGRLGLKRIGYLLYSPFLAGWFLSVTVLGLFGYRENLWVRTKRV